MILQLDGVVIRMVKVYKASDCELVGMAGYGRKYVADVTFKRKLDTAGFIWVRVPGGMKTDPHLHEKLEETFVILDETNMGVGETVYHFSEGDVVVVEPGEAHWFETSEDHDVRFIAIKFPNLKDDKVEPGQAPPKPSRPRK
jgi:mannose-6-phosphate isomerase-like protein (cupin superfamily)